MIRVGLTGGLASGKSTVSGLLAQLGALVLDHDRLAHQVYAKGTPGWERVVGEFGQDVVGENGEIDRKKLSAIVFDGKDKTRLKRLIDIVQPEIIRAVTRIFHEKEKEGIEVGILESAVLFKTEEYRLVEQTWVTYAPEDVVIQRLKTRDGLRLTLDEARPRIALLTPVAENLRRAHLVIRTDCPLAETRAQVLSAWKKLDSNNNRMREVEGLS